MPSGGVPYPILVFCGMLPWQFFSTALSESGNSLVTNSNLISKVYFPRLVVPASSVITSFVDFLISAAFLVVLMIRYRYLPSSNCYFLPLFVLLAFAASFGSGLWLAALMVEYRDFKFIVPFIVELLCQRLSGGVPEHDRASKMEALVFDEPDGRGDRRIPMVHPR